MDKISNWPMSNHKTTSGYNFRGIPRGHKDLFAGLGLKLVAQTGIEPRFPDLSPLF